MMALMAALARAWLLKNANTFRTPGCLVGRFQLIRHVPDFLSRVQIIVSLPGLLVLPPRLRIPTMRAKVKHVAYGFKVLPDKGIEVSHLPEGEFSQIVPVPLLLSRASKGID
jgi:hypothetical protein